MLKKLSIAAVILFATSSVSFAGAVPNMQEGNWEITTTMEMPGMPMNIPPVKYTQCLTKKDIIPQGSQLEQECKFIQTKVSGNTVTWIMECSGKDGKMKGNGKITYSGNSMKGKIEMTMSPSNMKMTSHLSGRRIGDCK
jgi:Protein of unknown function (DUF3617)